MNITVVCREVGEANALTVKSGEPLQLTETEGPNATLRGARLL